MSKINTGIARLALGAAILAVTGSAFAAPTLSLPPGSYTANLTFSTVFALPAYFTAVFGTPTIPPGFDVVQGKTYNAWCVEFKDDISFSGSAPTLTATGAGPFTFRNTLGTLPLDAQSANWGAVNWLLNNKGGNSVVDIQEAIWFLLNGSYHLNAFISSAPSAATVALVTAAEGQTAYVPPPGKIVAILADGGDGLKNDGTDVQSLIIEGTVPPQATGCPATQGFWHKASHWPDINKSVDGVIYNGATTHSMVIGPNTYSQGQLLAIMPSGSLHSGGYVNALSQYIAAVLNLAAGAQNAGIDATVTTITTDLAGAPPFVTGDGSALHPYALSVSPALQTILAGFEDTLDAYNSSAATLKCTEGAGLIGGK